MIRLNSEVIELPELATSVVRFMRYQVMKRQFEKESFLYSRTWFKPDLSGLKKTLVALRTDAVKVHASHDRDEIYSARNNTRDVFFQRELEREKERERERKEKLGGREYKQFLLTKANYRLMHTNLFKYLF